MLNDMLLGTTGVFLQVQAQTETVDDPNDVWAGWGSVILVSGTVFLVAVLLALLIWQIFRTSQTRMMTNATVTLTDSYRTLAEEATAAQTRTAEEIEQLREGVTDLRTRVATIERILAEVG